MTAYFILIVIGISAVPAMVCLNEKCEFLIIEKINVIFKEEISDN